LEVESNHPVILKVVPEEHHGLQLQNLPTAWTAQTAGGCRNFPSFGINPAW